jgi:histidine triad (HIT) family protein
MLSRLARLSAASSAATSASASSLSVAALSLSAQRRAQALVAHVRLAASASASVAPVRSFFFHRSSALLKMSEVGTDAPAPGSDTIFGKISRGELGTKFLHEDDRCVAFSDVNPQAPTHFLVVPKKPLAQLRSATAEDEALLGHLLVVASKVALAQGLEPGFRVVINDGKQGCQR